MWQRILLLASFCLCACASDDTPPGGSTSTGEIGSTSSTGDPAPPSTSVASSSSSTTGPLGPKQCRRSCAAAFDCCTPGVEPCPSMSYPGNFGCAQDVCVPASCSGDGECAAINPGSTCVELQGVLQCVVLCDNDTPCTSVHPSATCGPATDGGMDYCAVRCETGAIICSGECDAQSGRCTCESDDDCANGFSCA